MRTTKKEIRDLGETIAIILNKKTNTHDYYFDESWGVVKHHNNIFEVIVWVTHNDYKTSSKLSSIIEVLCELK